MSKMSFSDQIKTALKRVKSEEGESLITLHEYQGDFTYADDGCANINIVHNESLPSYLMFYCGKSKYNLSEDLDSFSFEKKIDVIKDNKVGKKALAIAGAALAGNHGGKGSWGKAAAIGMATSMVDYESTDKEKISFTLMLQFKDGLLFFGKTDKSEISKFFEAYSATNFEKFSKDMLNIIVTKATELTELRSSFKLQNTTNKQAAGIKMEELKSSSQLAIDNGTRIRLKAIQWNSANLTDDESLRVDEISKKLHDKMSLEKRASEYAEFAYNSSVSCRSLMSINTSTIKNSLPLLKESLSKLPSGGIKCVPKNALNILTLIGRILRDFFVKNKEEISQAFDVYEATLKEFQNNYMQSSEIRVTEDARMLDSFNREIKANKSREYPLDKITGDFYGEIAAALGPK